MVHQTNMSLLFPWSNGSNFAILHQIFSSQRLVWVLHWLRGYPRAMALPSLIRSGHQRAWKITPRTAASHLLLTAALHRNEIAMNTPHWALDGLAPAAIIGFRESGDRRLFKFPRPCTKAKGTPALSVLYPVSNFAILHQIFSVVSHRRRLPIHAFDHDGGRQVGVRRFGAASRSSRRPASSTSPMVACGIFW